ncbi:MAG: hypothetical protein P8Y94_12405, partial [Acidobacteriota bacterium]
MGAIAPKPKQPAGCRRDFRGIENTPTSLPGDLLRGTSDWETIGQLTELSESGIVFSDDTLQQQTLENAIAQNLVSQAVRANKETILNELS